MTIENSIKELLIAGGALSKDSYIPLANAQGSLVGMAQLTKMMLYGDESLKVAITRVSDHHPLMVSPQEWLASYNNGSYIVDGVAVIDSNMTFVIGKEETSLAWGVDDDAAGSTGNTYISGSTNTYKAMQDFDGAARTAKILAVTKYQETNRAPGWCNAYTTVTDYSSGWSYDKRKAGMWRLPTMGELTLMYSKKLKINALMLLIGGTALSNSWYWSCTEYSSTSAWFLYFSYGLASHGSKKDSGRVRPVCAF